MGNGVRKRKFASPFSVGLLLGIVTFEHLFSFYQGF